MATKTRDLSKSSPEKTTNRHAASYWTTRRSRIAPTNFLFASSGFLAGAASLIDIGGTLAEFNESLTPEQADALAFRADVEAIGEDFRDALDELKSELASREP